MFPILETSVGRAAFAHRQDRAGLAAAALREGLREVEVAVAVRFRPSALSPQQILDLAPGDVLRLGHPLSEPLLVTAGDAVTARGVPGMSGKRLACLIVEPSEGREHE